METGSFRTGTYLRLKVHDIPFAMVKHLNLYHPILVGGISLEEENAGYMQMRLKRQNWHMKLLKSRDPVIVSAGWRRYQTKPIYAMESANIRHQILKFTPEHNHCLAMVWGPLAPPRTRVAVVQSSKEAFRVAAKAVVLDPKPDMKIMKESKQKGSPLKIFKGRSALVDFTPDTEVSKYKCAPIRTSSGICGHVKEAAKRGGIAKCTFKKKICMSDIVFMRVMRQVEAPRFFNPVTTTLEPCDCFVPVNKDSLKKDDPAQGPLKLERRRRGVQIFDGEPFSFSCSDPLTVLYNVRFMNKNKRKIKKKKKNTVMSKKEQEAYKRGAEIFKRHQKEDAIALRRGIPMALEHWD
ncbi:hypothetical protein MKW94_002824 [Papaver nudicaule]|uniref:Ribosome biogenesis protein BMS1/TSR1 C-terminal domain-containing protein n=1 Tax=Papaver nudicaule TaxID=74823 RepID=A0AA41VD12_PAPNU|nr:hypothetical protein [Papaver nudicaule]